MFSFQINFSTLYKSALQRTLKLNLINPPANQPTEFFHLEGNITVIAYTNFALSLMMMRETNGRTESW